MSELLKQMSAMEAKGGVTHVYLTTRIDLDKQLSLLADAVEARAKSDGFRVEPNFAGINGAGKRASGENVCRYSVLLKNKAGKTAGSVVVWDTGKVNWTDVEPIEKFEPKARKAKPAIETVTVSA